METIVTKEVVYIKEPDKNQINLPLLDDGQLAKIGDNIKICDRRNSCGFDIIIEGVVENVYRTVAIRNGVTVLNRNYIDVTVFIHVK